MGSTFRVIQWEGPLFREGDLRKKGKLCLSLEWSLHFLSNSLQTAVLLNRTDFCMGLIFWGYSFGETTFSGGGLARKKREIMLVA